MKAPNQKDQGKKKDNRLIFLIATLLFCASGYFLFLALEEPIGVKPVGEIPPSVQQDVNFHLKKTLQQQELDRSRLETEHFSKMREIDPRPVTKDVSTERSLELEYDQSGERVANDLKGAAGDMPNSATVGDVVQTQLYEETMNGLLKDAYRKEYARQFVENARRKGYEIKLGPDYKVKSVKLISPKNEINLRDVSGGGFQ